MVRRISENNATRPNDLTTTTGETLVSKKGTGGYPNRTVSARSGDNAMIDEDDGDHGDVLDNLYDILQKAQVSDETMKSGVLLTAQGQQKLANHFSLPVEQIKPLLDSLSQRLRNEGSLEESYRRTMEDVRYSAESDTMGEVTIRDGKTGKEKVFVGSKGTMLLKKLDGLDPYDQQREMEKLFEITESEEVGDDVPFADEIKKQSGTYNFTARLNGKIVFGTAHYRAKDGSPEVSVISVRDQSGNTVKIDASNRSSLQRAAVDAMDEV